MIKKFMAVILLIFMFTTHVQAEEASSPLLKLDAIADQALQLTKLNRPEEAKQLLEYFSKEFSSTALQDKRLSMDEIRILTLS
ncbi:MAG TPA: sporulation protein YpjB, partial [Chondromyces sp.]|nr:sporulation protein YpjB [Chondromyces sp.]